MFIGYEWFVLALWCSNQVGHDPIDRLQFLPEHTEAYIRHHLLLESARKYIFF